MRLTYTSLHLAEELNSKVILGIKDGSAHLLNGLPYFLVMPISNAFWLKTRFLLPGTDVPKHACCATSGGPGRGELQDDRLWHVEDAFFYQYMLLPACGR